VSAGRIDIQPESLATAGSSLAQTAEQMADTFTGLQDAVTGSGNPWGGDETGTLFSGVYTAVLGHALDALGSYVEQVGYAGIALSRQAAELAETDSAAANRVAGAGGGL
jgi:hypothetical protein